jgi:predicted SAM-dependent methyltransferase
MQRLRCEPRTISGVFFDMRRLVTRVRRQPLPQPLPARLQLGAGARVVKGWLNCDIAGSQFNIDLATLPLPLPSGHFTDIVSQHVIEHLQYDPQVIDLFFDCFRLLQPGGRITLSCPDMEKLCRAYLEDGCAAIDKGLKRHWPRADLPGFPLQHRLNYYFHQAGQHKNLMDFGMLKWALEHAGFTEVQHVQEADLLAAYPEFPPRRDDFESLYVTARRPLAA